MRRTYRLLFLAAGGLILALSAWMLHERRSHVRVDTTGPTAAGPTASKRPAVASDPSAPLAITLPVYRAELAGLPSVDTPLRESYATLKSAAARGNATAACRLAFAALDCWSFHFRSMPPESATPIVNDQAQPAPSDDPITVGAARRINEAPASLRGYVESRVDAIELARATAADAARATERLCRDSTLIGTEEAVRLLRQAALAGRQDAVVAYAQGTWQYAILGRNAARTPDEAPPPVELLSEPAYRVWRREAAAVHRAALAAGLLQAIELEATHNRFSPLDGFIDRDPLDEAAALRALAGLVGTAPLPSTGTLGLDAADAAEADRRADAWMAAARRRDVQSDPHRVIANSFTGLDGPTSCE